MTGAIRTRPTQIGAWFIALLIFGGAEQLVRDAEQVLYNPIGQVLTFVWRSAFHRTLGISIYVLPWQLLAVQAMLGVILLLIGWFFGRHFIKA